MESIVSCTLQKCLPRPTSRFSFSHSNRFDSNKFRGFTENGIVFSLRPQILLAKDISCVLSCGLATASVRPAWCPPHAQHGPCFRFRSSGWHCPHGLGTLFVIPSADWDKPSRASRANGESQSVYEQCSPDQRTHQFGVGLPGTKIVKYWGQGFNIPKHNLKPRKICTATNSTVVNYQISFQMVQICGMLFPNTVTRTHFLCAYRNTQPHWGELDRHLIAWPNKGKEWQQKLYTPGTQKNRFTGQRKDQNSIATTCSSVSHFFRLPRPAFDRVGKNGTHAASIWSVGWLGKLNLKNAVTICYAPQNWMPKHQKNVHIGQKDNLL